MTACVRERALATCAGPGQCTADTFAGWCRPQIRGLTVAPNPWTAPEAVILTTDTLDAEECSWGASTVDCNGATTIATNCAPGCTAIQLVACNRLAGVHCEGRFAFSECTGPYGCSCTFFGWGTCP